jgi:hypothetical protein
MGGTKLERFLPKNQQQHTERKLMNFENWVNSIFFEFVDS